MFGYFVAIIAIFFLMTCCRAFSRKNYSSWLIVFLQFSKPSLKIILLITGRCAENKIEQQNATATRQATSPTGDLPPVLYTVGPESIAIDVDGQLSGFVNFHQGIVAPPPYTLDAPPSYEEAITVTSDSLPNEAQLSDTTTQSPNNEEQES